jgi:hypothetical protein
MQAARSTYKLTVPSPHQPSFCSAGKAGLINRLGRLVEVPRDTLAVFVEAADAWQLLAGNRSRAPKALSFLN